MSMLQVIMRNGKRTDTPRPSTRSGLAKRRQLMTTYATIGSDAAARLAAVVKTPKSVAVYRGIPDRNEEYTCMRIKACAPCMMMMACTD
jgi:hypothetical protein